MAATSAPIGAVSYRLARERVVADVRAGRRTRTEVCDAQPELRRVVEHGADPTGDACPICDDADLVLATFAFGPGLPAGGRAVMTDDDVRRLRRRSRVTVCYVVEVCPNCWWNHLRESFTFGDRAVGA